ncbi:MAG: phosphoglycerate dehydrogenase [Chloroflexota bacterium]
MAAYKVMISAPYMQPVIDRFRPTFEEHDIELVVPVVHERLEEADLLPLVADLDGAITGDDRFTERVIAAAPKLKVISKWGTGIDSIDQEACRRHGVAVRNTPNAFSEPVADSVLGYMLSFARRLPWMDRQMKAGEWDKIPGRALRECTLGVIGVGNVGKAVIRRASAFGMRILGTDPVTPPDDFILAHNIIITDLDTLLREADFISVNCDLNPTSERLINDETLAKVRPSAVLINTARGPIVDEPALVRALESGRLAGAGLDVFMHEPLPVESPLRHMDQVMLAPHNSNSSPQAWEHVHHNTIRNLLEELQR